MAGFSLSKWYLDATDNATGETVICYWGRLRYGPISLSYSSVLHTLEEEPEARTHTSWRTSDPPQIDGETVPWSNEALGVNASWDILNPDLSFGRTLLENNDGSVRWDVVASMCHGGVWLNRGGLLGRRYLGGNGYIERLELTLPPWKLPIDELRWGRAILTNAQAIRALTWIDWRGPHPLTLVFVNQHEMPDAAVLDATVSGGGRRLDLAPAGSPGGRVLRDGPLVTSALAGAPGLRDWAPASILSAHESKRLSRCVLTDPIVGQLHGWAIHEVVRFRDRTGA